MKNKEKPNFNIKVLEYLNYISNQKFKNIPTKRKERVIIKHLNLLTDELNELNGINVIKEEEFHKGRS